MAGRGIWQVRLVRLGGVLGQRLGSASGHLAGTGSCRQDYSKARPLLEPCVAAMCSAAAARCWPLLLQSHPQCDADAAGRLWQARCALQGAPETFRRLGQAEGKMRAAMGGNLGALQCTHPRSDTRVQMLEEELQLMAEAGDSGRHRVLHSVPYWMLSLVACALAPGLAGQT